MLTPRVSDASPRASRVDATSTSWADVDAQPAEVLGDRRREVAAPLDGGEALEGIAPVAVVLGCVGADLLRERFGELDEPGAGRGLGRQLERHGVLRPSDCVPCAIERPVRAAEVHERLAALRTAHLADAREEDRVVGDLDLVDDFAVEVRERAGDRRD